MFNPNLISRLPQPVSCRLLAPLLTQYVEAPTSLKSGERKAVADHLHACPACAEEAEAIQAMSGFLQERAPLILPAPVPRADLWERIEARIIAEERPVKQVRSLRPVLVFAPAFAALIVAAIVVPRASQTKLSATKTAAIAPAAPATAFKMAEANNIPEQSRFAASVSRYGDSMYAAAAQEANTFSGERRIPSQPVIVAVNRPKPAQKVAMRGRLANASRSFAVASRPKQEVRDYVLVTVAPKPLRQEPVAVGNAARPANTGAGFNVLANTDSVSVYATNNDSVNNAHADNRASAPAAEMSIFNAHTSSSSAVVRKAAPSTAAPSAIASSVQTSKTITIVDSPPGSGVPESASYTTPVTETLIRSRQRRGLFGGYGAGVTAMVPAGNNTKTNESETPW